MSKGIKGAIKAILPSPLLHVVWAFRHYDFWHAKRIALDYFEQPFRKRQYHQLNRGQPPDTQVLPPGIQLRVIPELRRLIELYSHIDMRSACEMRGFVQYARGRKCLLDIGALYGDFSLVFCALTGGSAVAVDPSPEANRVLAKLIEANPEARIHPYPIALGAESGPVEMKFEWIHCVLHPRVDKNLGTVRVEQKTIDRFVAELPERPDVVKIDAEGAEIDILKGGRAYFKEHAPRIFLEVHPTYLAQRHQSVAELIELLADYGYRVYHSDGLPVKNPSVILSRHEGFLVHRVICDRRENERKGRLAR